MDDLNGETSNSIISIALIALAPATKSLAIFPKVMRERLAALLQEVEHHGHGGYGGAEPWSPETSWSHGVLFDDKK